MMPRKLLTPAEVATLWHVDPKTVTRWAQTGKLNSIKTPGGHRRFFEDEIHKLLEAGGMPSSEVLDLPEDTTGYGIGTVTSS